MLLLIPVFLLIISAVAIQVLGRTRFNIVQTWVFALVISSVTWIYFIVLRIIEPSTLIINYLETGTSDAIRLLINFSPVTWVFGFLLLTTLGGILLSDAGRLSEKNNLVIWSGTMIIAAAGVFACMAESLVAFILASTFLDISLLVFHLVVNSRNGQHQKTLLEFTMRITGTLIFMTTLGNASFTSNGQIIEFPGSVLFLIIFGVILRMGIFHPRVWSVEHGSIRPNLQVLTHVVVPITMFAFISRLPLPAFTGFPFTLIYIAIIVITLYRAGSLFSEKFFSVRTWIDIISGLGVGLLLLGEPAAILPLGIVMVTIAGITSVTVNMSKWTKYILLALLLGMVGLPFTPTTHLWITPVGAVIPFFPFLYDITLAVALVGIFYKLTQKFDRKLSAERRIDQSRDLSPIILLIAPWIFLPWAGNLAGSQTGLIIAGVIVVFSIISLSFRKRWNDILQQTQTEVENRLKGNPSLWNFIKNFFQFNWFFGILKTINSSVQWIVTTLIRVLEGEGGLLWALVFLILITSIIITYRLTL